jgi:hypothetical protein
MRHVTFVIRNEYILAFLLAIYFYLCISTFSFSYYFETIQAFKISLINFAANMGNKVSKHKIKEEDYCPIAITVTEVTHSKIISKAHVSLAIFDAE